MENRLARLGFVGLARDVFEDRLSLIHVTIAEMRLRHVWQPSRGAADTMYAEEPT